MVEDGATGSGSGSSGARAPLAATGMAAARGGGRAYVSRLFLASELGSSETVTIGAGSAGGAARTANDTSGAAGTVGAIHPSAQFLLPMARRRRQFGSDFQRRPAGGSGALAAGTTSTNAQSREHRLGGM